MLKNFFRNEKGATAIEYGLFVALIAVVIVGGVSAAGTELSAVFDTIQASLK